MTYLQSQFRKLAGLSLLIGVFVAGFALGNLNTVQAIGDTDEAFEPLFEVFDIIQDRYVDAADVNVPMLIDGAIQGMVDSLGDQFSGYLTPESFELFNTDLSGNVEGIGVVIRTIEETGQIEVVSLIRGAAAERSGVLPGDIFIAVDGESVEGLNQTELAALVRGPAGTDVQITFLRGEELIDLTITRVSFEVPNVTSELLEEDIAYIRLAEFNSNSLGQLNAAFEELDVNSRAGLIFDLRGNPGGLLTSAVQVASAFIEEGVILYETFGDGSEEVFEATGDYAGVGVPIVVLIDEGSASASELVAGAMRDRGVATLFGETTFGKGTVQTLQPLSNDGALRITIARYLLPSRQWIHDLGVTPDFVVAYNPVEDGLDVDPQLDAAVDFLLGN